MTRPLLHGPRPHKLLPFALALAGLPLSAQFTTDNTVDSWTGPEFEVIRGLRTFDVEGDGDQDIFLCRHNPSIQGNFSWYENTGQGVFAPPVILHTADQSYPDVARDFDLADIDADGDLDLVYVTELSSNIYVRTFDAGAFGPPETWGTMPGSGVFIRWMQLNPWEDSLIDVVIHVEINYPHGLYNTGGALGSPFVIGSGQSGLGPDYLEVGDFTGNYGDILTKGAGNLYLYTQFSDGDGGYYWSGTDLGPTAWTVQVLDVDDDGDDDIGLANADSTGWLRSPGLYGELQYEQLEPASALGIFGKVDCDPYTDLFSLFFSDFYDPYISYGHDSDGLNIDAPTGATGIPNTGRFPPVLVDLDEDGLNDPLMVVNDTTLHWYANDGPEPSVLSLPPLDTLCAMSSGYILPTLEPSGGTWSGEGVTDGLFSAVNLLAGDIPLLYEASDPEGCLVSGSTTVHVIYYPTFTSTPWDECSFIPVQFEGSPAGGEWIGLADSTGLAQLTPGLSGGVQYSFIDVTGGSCMSLGAAIINMSYPTVPNIGYTGPYCLNAEQYQVIPVLVGNPGSMSFWSWVDSVNYITPGSAQMYYLADTLGLDTIIIGSSRPQYCPSTDTLIIEVVAPVEVTLDAFTDTLVNGCAGAYTLTGGLPAGGTFSGDGVVDDIFDPEGLLGDIAITYSYDDGGGCSGSATQTIHVIEAVSVTPGSVQQCVAEGGIQLTVQPIPEVWFDAIVSPSGLLNTALPFNGAVYCAWTDVLGCQTYGSVNVSLTAYSEGSVSVAGQDPFPEQVCLSNTPFTIDRSLVDGSTEAIAFDPLAEGLGTYEYIGYAIDDGSGCLRNDTLSFEVVDAPVVSMAAFTDTLFGICEESAYALTQGQPAGGTYSGDGVIDGVFHPFENDGNTAITYTYSAGPECTGSAYGIIVTNSFVGSEPYTALEPIRTCVGDEPVQMTSYPNGAVWSGAAITPEGYVDMAAPFGGQISFVITDAAGCENGLTMPAFIGAYTLGTVTIPPGSEVVCVDAPAFLVSYSTSDGAGVDTLFDPAVAGPGTFYFTGQGVIEPGPTQCYQDVTDSVVVLDGAVALVLDLGPLYTDGIPVPLVGGTPEGGIYSGTGVSNGEFSPAAAGYGWHLITYTTDSGACAGEAVDSVFVDSGTGMAAYVSVPALHVWPVPAQDLLQVSLPAHTGTIALVVTDARGREVLRNTFATGTTGRTVTLGTTNLTNGTYTLFARGPANTMPARIIIAR